MKKILLCIGSALLLSHGLNAQISLSQSSYTTTFAGTRDTVLNSILSSTYPSLLGAANANWNLSNSVSLTSMTQIPHVSPYTTAYANAQYADSVMFSFSGFAYLAYVENAITGTGFVALGEHISRQSVHPTGSGFSANDSIIFDNQNIVYSTPDTLLSFPATYNHYWHNSYNYDFNFHLDVALLSFSNTPGTVRAYVNVLDSVVGWGTMKVLNLDGTVSSPINVIQVQESRSTMDSFFISGAPASAFVLGAFQVTQGQTTMSYTQNFYQVNQVTPLASVTFTDGTFVTGSAAHTMATGPLSTGVQNLNGNEGVTMYPNPVKGGNVVVKIENATSGNYTYSLIDINGKTIAAGNLNMNGGEAIIGIPGMLAGGIYFMQINCNGERLKVQPLDIAK
jgi:hypothetical protein